MRAATAADVRLGWYLILADDHGSRKVKATVVDLANGKLRNLMFYQFEPWTFYDGLEVYAYLDNRSHSDGHAWGFGHEYRPFSVELPRAEAMTKVLRRLNRDLPRDHSANGYPLTWDEYLFSVARVLKIQTYARPATVQEQAAEIERRGASSHHRIITASGVQDWLAEQERDWCQPAQAGGLGSIGVA
jgi:hypothetical protein